MPHPDTQGAAPPNPRALICDTDALVQCFIANELRPFRVLHEQYGVQSVIVDEVDVELRWVRRRYRDRFVAHLDKALRNGLLRKLDLGIVRSCLGDATVSAAAAVEAQIQTIGADYSKYVQPGEAYTHAAAVVLGVPSLSHDFRALQVLDRRGLQLPATVLRLYDLLVFAYSGGHITEKDCDSVRKALLHEGEGVVPKAFQTSSFASCAAGVGGRLYDVSNAPTLLAVTSSFSNPLLLRRP